MGEKGKEEVKSLEEKDSCCFEASWKVQEIRHFQWAVANKKVPEIIKGSWINLFSQNVSNSCIWNHISMQQRQPQSQ